MRSAEMPFAIPKGHGWYGWSWGVNLRSDNDHRNDPSPPGKKRAAKVHSKDRDMGSALRSVYQRTIDEKVPDEMLDLLGKLGDLD